MTPRKHVVVTWPTSWEVLELSRPEVSSRYRLSYLPLPGMGKAHPDLATEVRGQLRLLRVEAFLHEAVEALRDRPPDGVIGTEDHLGAILAAAIATPLGLPAPPPAAMLLCQHKHRSRLVQAACVPEATPWFVRVDPRDLRRVPTGVTFPCFAKPVRGSFSVFARRVKDLADLRRLTGLAWGERLFWDLRQRPFEALLRRHTGSDEGSRCFLAEELLVGQHVSVEGFRHRGQVTVMGALDATMYGKTDSFRRFELPSRLPPGVQERMTDIARRVIRATGYDDGLFEVEMFYDPSRDLVRIIEINPRMCPQYADLFEKVHGASSFDLLLSIATGERPAWSTGAGPFGCAASFVFRIFDRERVVRLPSETEIGRAQTLFPDLRVHLFAREGKSASARMRALHDCSSVRIATVHLGGADRADLMDRFRRALLVLPFQVDPPRDYSRVLTE